MQQTKASFGFTLLEILVAIFIFSIIAVMMMSGLHILLNTQSVIEKKSQQLAELQMALIVIARDIEQTIDRPITNAKNIVGPSFSGSGREVFFTRTGWANPEAAFPRSNMQRVHYFLHNKNLIRETWDVLDLNTKSMAQEKIILQNVTDLSFEFLGETKHFVALWPTPDQPDKPLPKAVRLKLNLGQAGTLFELYLLPQGTSFETAP